MKNSFIVALFIITLNYTYSFLPKLKQYQINFPIDKKRFLQL